MTQDEEHDVIVTMPASELQRICRDLSNFGDSVNISCTKDGVSFSASGDLGSGRITLRQNYNVDKEDEQVSHVTILVVEETFSGLLPKTLIGCFVQHISYDKDRW